MLDRVNTKHHALLVPIAIVTATGGAIARRPYRHTRLRTAMAKKQTVTSGAIARRLYRHTRLRTTIDKKHLHIMQKRTGSLLTPPVCNHPSRTRAITHSQHPADTATSTGIKIPPPKKETRAKNEHLPLAADSTGNHCNRWTISAKARLEPKWLRIF